MIKANDVGGKPVITRDGGQKIASVKELVASPDRTRVIALLLDGGGLMSEDRVVPIDQVVSVGPDAVIVTGAGAIFPANQHQEVAQSMKLKDNLGGKRVVTDRGEAQGTVRDIAFEEGTGRIAGFELSKVTLGDRDYENVFLPANDVISVGPDAMIVRADSIPRLVGYTAGTAAAPPQNVAVPQNATAAPGVYPQQAAPPRAYPDQPPPIEVRHESPEQYSTQAPPQRDYPPPEPSSQDTPRA